MNIPKVGLHYMSWLHVSFLHTDGGPLKEEIKRVKKIMGKGLVIFWKVHKLPPPVVVSMSVSQSTR